jgi:hypothetical protein
MENALKPFVRPRTKSSISCSGITKRACTQPWATSAPCSSNKTGIAAPQPLQTDGAEPMKAGYGKAGKQKTLSNFPTATTTTNYYYLWDTDSEGKVSLQDGLAWQNPDGSWSGPVSEAVVKALLEGYVDKRKPFHGYYFKVLKGQGPGVYRKALGPDSLKIVKNMGVYDSDKTCQPTSDN